MFITRWKQEEDETGYRAEADVTHAGSHLRLTLTRSQQGGWTTTLYDQSRQQLLFEGAGAAHPCTALDDLFEALLGLGDVVDLTPLANVLLPAHF